MKLSYALRDFFFPPICPGCYDVFKAEYGKENEMCPTCKNKWELLKANICPSCGERFADCRCMPKLLKSSGVFSLIKLVPYGRSYTVSNNTVLYIKRRRDARVIRFLSGQLSYEIERYIKKLGLRRDDAVVAFCPRRRSAVNKTGFDQARLLANEVSRQMNIPMSCAIKRSSILKKAQKKLNAAGRVKNASGAFKISDNGELKNKTVFLIDDLVTTGATMAECARLVRNAGAALTVGVCVAYTEKS